MTDLTSLNVAGVPILGGGVPASFGDAFYVSVEEGSDNYDGRSMHVNGGSGPFKTVSKANSVVTSNNHDLIILSGVSAHTISTTLAVTKSRVHFIGLGGGSRYVGQRTRWEMGVTTDSETSLMRVTGTGCTFTNIKFRSVDTNSDYTVEDGGEFSQFTNCSFEHGAQLTTATIADLLCNSDTALYLRCGFGSAAYQINAARQNVLFTRNVVSGKFCRDVEFNDCRFLAQTLSSGTGFVNLRATLNDIERWAIFDNCKFINSGLSTGTQALVWGVGTTLARAEPLMTKCVSVNITDLSGATGVHTDASVKDPDGDMAVATSLT